MLIRVLGSAAGGGFPQLNCNCDNCRGVRDGQPGFSRRTQTSIAVNCDGASWTLFGASPDLRQQVAKSRDLRSVPDGRARGSPIEAVVLTNAEIDSVAGLLSLREGFVFDLLATPRVLATLKANSIFDVLSADAVRRMPMLANERCRTGSGLEIELFPVPGKIALYAEACANEPASHDADTVGVQISDPASGASFFYIPSCGGFDRALAERLQGAKVLFFDGTLYTDDEMIVQRLSHKSGHRMGHMAMSGPGGAIAALAGLGIGRRIFVHINNSNPVLNEQSAARRDVERAGWEIAFDGMEIRL